MFWKLLERLGIVKRCCHCDEWYWRRSPVDGGPGFLSYCRKCFEYFARGDD